MAFTGSLTMRTMAPSAADVVHDLAVQAELLSADGKNVVASAVSPSRRMLATVPIAVELSMHEPVPPESAAVVQVFAQDLVAHYRGSPFYNLPGGSESSPPTAAG